MPVIKKDKVMLLLGHSSQSPSDSTTYYWGNPQFIPVATTATWRKIYVPVTGVIISAELTVNCTHGTAENVNYKIRKNNTTDYDLGDVPFTTDNEFAHFTGLNIPIASGDYIEIKELTPAWVTNPTTLVQTMLLLIKCA